MLGRNIAVAAFLGELVGKVEEIDEIPPKLHIAGLPLHLGQVGEGTAKGIA